MAQFLSTSGDGKLYAIKGKTVTSSGNFETGEFVETDPFWVLMATVYVFK